MRWGKESYYSGLGAVLPSPPSPVPPAQHFRMSPRSPGLRGAAVSALEAFQPTGRQVGWIQASKSVFLLPVKAQPLGGKELICTRLWHQEAGGPRTSRVTSYLTETSLRASWRHCPAHCLKALGLDSPMNKLFLLLSRDRPLPDSLAEGQRQARCPDPGAAGRRSWRGCSCSWPLPLSLVRGLAVPVAKYSDTTLRTPAQAKAQCRAGSWVEGPRVPGGTLYPLTEPHTAPSALRSLNK